MDRPRRAPPDQAIRQAAFPDAVAIDAKGDVAAGTDETLNSGQARLTYEPTIHLSAHLGPTWTNRTLSIYA